MFNPIDDDVEPICLALRHGGMQLDATLDTGRGSRNGGPDPQGEYHFILLGTLIVYI